MEDKVVEKNMKHHKYSEKGVTSILTVLFFIVLVSVITIGFTRLMSQEFAQGYEDELTKSAYNAATAGVEDAKRAILFCSAQVGSEKTNCETELYTATCPGFNTGTYFQTKLGIPQSNSGKTKVSDSGQEGYSCVTVSRNTQDIKGTLSYMSGSGSMFELKTNDAAGYKTVRISWRNPTNSTTLYPQSRFNTGNPRAFGTGSEYYWNYDGSLLTSPTVLRVMVISVPEGAFNLADIKQQSVFVYPQMNGSVATISNIDNGAVPVKRMSTLCDTAQSWTCSVDISYFASHKYNQYILLKPVYSDAVFSMTATTALGAPVTFNNVQLSIDSTGYTAGLSRRIQTTVHAGGPAINTSNAIDSGGGLCKNFRVGLANLFTNIDYNNCKPL